MKEYRLDRFWAEYGSWRKLVKFWIFAGGRKLWRPKWTAKVAMITASALIIMSLVVKIMSIKGIRNGELGIGMLILFYLFVPLIVFLIVLFLKIPTYLLKLVIYKKAARKIAGMPQLIVIGITGSYGKSSTKEFLAQILEKKFKVLKTPENVNTEIGVARYILKSVDTCCHPEFISGSQEMLKQVQHDKWDNRKTVFIVEMGAYKMGEIKRIRDIVKPKIGIITGVNEQHLALFGSLENIMKAKYELIESLPEEGLAVFNGENKYCLEMAEWWRGKKIIYDSADIWGQAPNRVRVQTPDVVGILPGHYLLNLVGAVEVAKYLGMSDEEIREVVKNIKLTDRMLKTYIGRGGALIIEDTYSANPDGVLAALDYLAEQKQKIKILVMPCLIELGGAGERVHREIGKKIAEVCDLAIITASDYFGIIKEEAGAVVSPSNQDKAVLAIQSEKAIELLKDKLNSDTAVLLEGRLAEEIVEFLR